MTDLSARILQDRREGESRRAHLARLGVPIGYETFRRLEIGDGKPTALVAGALDTALTASESEPSDSQAAE